MTESLIVCLNAVLPVFLLMAAGYFAKRVGILREKDVPSLNILAFQLLLPVMNFYNIYTSDLTGSVRPRLLLFAVCGILLVFAAAWLYAHRAVRDPRQKGVVVQGIFRSNFIIVGLPIAASLLKGQDLGVIALLSSVVIPLYNILAVVVLEMYRGGRPSWRKLALDVLKNPLLLGCVAGVLALLIKLKLPSPVTQALSQMSAAASPLMLILLGAFFRFGTARQHLRQLAVVCVGRLVMVPALMLTLAAVLGFRGVEFVALVGVFASATATSSFTMAQQLNGDAALAGDIVVFTSVICSFTLFLWCLLFRTLGMF